MTRMLTVDGGLEDIRSSTLHDQIVEELEQGCATPEDWSRLRRMIEDGVDDGDLAVDDGRELLKQLNVLGDNQEEVLSGILATDSSHLSDVDRALALEQHIFREQNACAHVCTWLVHNSRVNSIRCMADQSVCTREHCPAKQS